MISAVAALAVLATGAMAFECAGNGQIQTAGVVSGYKNDFAGQGLSTIAHTLAAPLDMSKLKLSDHLKGDALIYPLFTQKKGEDGNWETEIVVRNTTNKATIAKVALYRDSDTEEVLDFNIFLSPKDAFRFKIADGQVTTSDSSIIGKQTLPSIGASKDSITMNADKDYVINNAPFNTEAGYVVIYGMAQYDDNTPDTKDVYHKDELSLAYDYRTLLDACRDGWRNAYTESGMIQGMMTVPVNLPALPDHCVANVANPAAYTSKTTADLTLFGDVEDDSLIGTVRVYNSAAGNERDMVLNATALQNYTENNMMLWAPGEFADFADRGLSTAFYEKAKVLDVAKAFMVNDAIYTYRAEDVQNTLIVTQPMKRRLFQLGLAQVNNYWTNFSSSNIFGGFQMGKEIYNEMEDQYSAVENVEATKIISPFNSTTTEVYTYNYELQAISNLEYVGGNIKMEDGKAVYKNGAPVYENQKPAFEGNGFVKVNFLGNATEGLPGIVTQMVGTHVGAEGAKVAQTNWIYAPVSRTAANK